MRDEEAIRAIEQMKRRSQSSTAYNKANTTVITVRLNKNTEADVIEWLDKQPNKSGLIKELIRGRMKGETNEIP